MFAIQPLTLPPANQLLLALDPAADPQADPGFAAQFSALLASAGPAQTATVASSVPARPALPGSRGGKEQAANGNQGGNILPESLADMAEPQVQTDSASQSPGIVPAEEVLPSAALALQIALAPIAAPMPPAGPVKDDAVDSAAHAAPAANVATSLAPEAQPTRWLARASTAPASSSTLLPQGPGGAAALPPAIADHLGDPATVAAMLPAIRISRAQALPGAPVVLLASGDAPLPAVSDEFVAGRVKSTLVSLQVPLAVQASGEAQAATMALAQQVRKPAEPIAPLGAPDAQPVSGLEAIAAPASQPAATGTGAIPVTAPQAAPPQPHDFAALIDRLVEARQAVQATAANQTVLASVQHAEFGRVSLAFQQDAGGLTVSFANPDPDLARAVQSLTPVAAPVSSGDAGAGAQRQDWQGSGSAGSGQAQSHAPAQQQRGQSSHREPCPESTAPDRTSDSDPASPSAPRGGIFA